MAGQIWAASDQGQLLYSPLMSKEVTLQMQPLLRFAQFCEIKEEWGKNAGETFLYDLVGDIDTQGGQLTETATIPAHSYAIQRGTCTLYEWGNSIPFTNKYEALAQVSVRGPNSETLSNDAARVLDTAVEAQFDRTKIRYVGDSTGVGTITTNGSATKTCTSIFNAYHCKQMVDYMFQTLKCDPYDGEDYMAICTTNAKRGVYDDVESIMQYTKYPASGEFGRFYDTRFVKTNHGMSNAMGASSAYGEMYMFGKKDPVLRGIAEKLRVIPKETSDYGRSKGLAWYSIEGFSLMHRSNPDSNVIKYCDQSTAT